MVVCMYSVCVENADYKGVKRVFVGFCAPWCIVCASLENLEISSLESYRWYLQPTRMASFGWGHEMKS